MSDNNRNISVNISTGTLFKVVLIGVLILAIVKLRSLVLVILTAIVVASFVESAVLRMKKFIKNRTLAVFIIYFLSFSVIVGLFSVFIPVFIEEMSALVAQLGHYIPNTSVFTTLEADTTNAAKDVVKTISQKGSISDVINSTQSLMQSVSGGFFNVFGSAFGGVFNMGLIVIISFYLSVKEKGIENFLRIITPERSEEYVIGLWRRTERKIGLWIQGQMLLGIIIGTLAFLGLTIIGVKYAFVLALVAGIMELIPFGIFLSVIPATIFSFLDGGVTLSLMTFGLYMILHQFENYLIAPLIVKKVIGISPLIVILSVIIGFELAGFWGVILSIPMAVLILEFTDDLEKKKILSRMN
jgi:predicted PurR-regulated permease PerM